VMNKRPAADVARPLAASPSESFEQNNMVTLSEKEAHQAPATSAQERSL